MNESETSVLNDVPLEVEVAVPGVNMRLADVLELAPGLVIATVRRNGDVVDVFAGGVRIGCGELSVSKRGAQLRMTRLGAAD